MHCYVRMRSKRCFLYILISPFSSILTISFIVSFGRSYIYGHDWFFFLLNAIALHLLLKVKKTIPVYKSRCRRPKTQTPGSVSKYVGYNNGPLRNQVVHIFNDTRRLICALLLLFTALLWQSWQLRGRPGMSSANPTSPRARRSAARGWGQRQTPWPSLARHSALTRRTGSRA